MPYTLNIRPEEWAIVKHIYATNPVHPRKISRKDTQLWLDGALLYFKNIYPYPGTIDSNSYAAFIETMAWNFVLGQDDSGTYFTAPVRDSPYERWAVGENPLHSFELVDGVIYGSAVHHMLGSGIEANVKIIESEAGHQRAKRTFLETVETDYMRHIHTYNQTIKKECSLHQKLNRFYDGYYTEKDIEPNSDIDQKCIMPSQKGLFTSYMIKKARTFIPLYPHGNLDQFLQFLEASPHRENKRIRLTVALKVLQCIEADAHALNIAHNDIKGANMMIGWPEHIAPCIEELPRYIEHMNCQLIDYGFSENLDGKPSEDAFMVDTAGAYDLLMLCLSPEHQNLIAMYDQMKPDLDMLQTIKRRLELLLDDSSERNLKLLAACCSEPMSYI